MQRLLLLFLAYLPGLSLLAQDSTAFKLETYAEIYYLYDFNQPAANSRLPYAVSYDRHNESNLNLGYLKASLDREKLRAKLALMAGTYSQANLAAEPRGLQHVLEAQVGLKLSTKHELWLDAGIFPSHIGFESAIGMDNYTLSRSLAADNSPYFESGIKLGYTSPGGRWFLSALYLNGWQRIQRVNASSAPNLGTQISFRASKKLLLNSSGFAGTEFPDSSRRMRYFHNFYTSWEAHKKWTCTAGLDIGAEQMTKSSSRYHWWYSPLLILSYSPGKEWKMAFRAEYYDDKSRVILKPASGKSFRCSSFSLNLDRKISSFASLRCEYRYFMADAAVFEKGKGTAGTDSFVALALCARF